MTSYRKPPCDVRCQVGRVGLLLLVVLGLTALSLIAAAAMVVQSERKLFAHQSHQSHQSHQAVNRGDAACVAVLTPMGDASGAMSCN